MRPTKFETLLIFATKLQHRWKNEFPISPHKLKFTISMLACVCSFLDLKVFRSSILYNVSFNVKLEILYLVESFREKDFAKEIFILKTLTDVAN
jgi:hypothetical protein